MTDLHARLRRYGHFNAKVPRFTSYPPANRFTEQVTQVQAGSWLDAVPPGADVSVYVHIPFCRRLCWFCAYRTQGIRTNGPLARYVDTLLSEIRMVRARLPGDVRLARLHLGGGTPTILPAAQMDRLLHALEDAFGAGPRDGFSVEIDPLEVDRPRLEILARHGLTRASLGVQDFAPRVQAAIGRPQSVEQTRAIVDMLRAPGITELNVDLLYGLPFQTGESLSRTLDQVLGLEPGRLALYGYAHVPWMSKRQMMIPVDALPGPEARYTLFETARKALMAQGYAQIGIDHFARPGDDLARALVDRRLARDFQGYSEDRVPYLIGLGASAISKLPQGYAQNQPATALYQAAIAAGRPATCRGLALSADDKARAEAIQQLMCYHAVRLGDPVLGTQMAGWLEKLVALYPDAMRFDGRILTVEPWARPLVRIFAARLGDTHRSEQSFSAAI